MKNEAPIIKKVFLAGSSHTRMLFLYIKDIMREDAIVSKLPYDAGNTAEILRTIEYWPIEDKNIVHIYTGHRDLMPDESGRPFIDKDQFKKNLKQIIEILLARTKGIIVFSNIPPVADSFLEIDQGRNEKISKYNSIIERFTKNTRIAVHDFQGFVVAYPKTDYLYSDGLHFTRNFYRIYAADLAVFLKKYL